MRIISLNIAQLAGRSGFIPLAARNAPRIAPRLADLLQDEAPDVVALQEAPPPSAAGDFVSTLLGPGVSVIRPPGSRHGPALLVRGGVRASRAELFVEGSGDGKGYAWAELETGLIVVSIHLAVVNRWSRRRQVDRLSSLLIDRSGPKIVVGDLNDARDAPARLSRSLHLVRHPTGPTFPSIAPALRLDCVLTSPDVDVTRLHVLRHLPSDHCAIRVDVGNEAQKPQRRQGTRAV